MRRERSDLTGVLVVSALLHAGLLAAGMVSWPWARRIEQVQVTPVTLLTTEELARLTAAAQSPTPEPAEVEDPLETAPPDAAFEEPAPVAPEPPPAPAAKAAPKAEPKPAKPVEKTAPGKAEPKTSAAARPPSPNVDLNALAESIAKTARPSGPTRSAAPKGPTRPETDLQARPPDGAARATTQTAMNGIVARLQRVWNPNCAVEAAAGVQVRVRLQLAMDGRLTRAELVDYRDVNAIGDPVVRAAAIRAMSAVSAASPYPGLPQETYDDWRSFVVNFNAKAACGGR